MCAGNASPVDVDDPGATARDFPLFKHALARRCTLHAGEALYLPMYWFHRVRSSPGRTASLAYFSRGAPEKKRFFQKILCGTPWVGHSALASNAAVRSHSCSYSSIISVGSRLRSGQICGSVDCSHHSSFITPNT